MPQLERLLLNLGGDKEDGRRHDLLFSLTFTVPSEPPTYFGRKVLYSPTHVEPVYHRRCQSQDALGAAGLVQFGIMLVRDLSMPAVRQLELYEL